MGVRARGTALSVLLALVVLAGCGDGPDGSSSPVATSTAIVSASADCMAPAVLEDLGVVPASPDGFETGSTSTPEVGAVPDGFVPVSVLVCTPDGSLHDASGTWLALTASHREGDLGPLLAALEQPSDEPTATCGSVEPEALALWLVDALGRAVRPSWPTDGCGSPAEDVTRALAALDETDREQYPVEESG